MKESISPRLIALASSEQPAKNQSEIGCFVTVLFIFLFQPRRSVKYKTRRKNCNTGNATEKQRKNLIVLLALSSVTKLGSC